MSDVNVNYDNLKVFDKDLSKIKFLHSKPRLMYLYDKMVLK